MQRKYNKQIPGRKKYKQGSKIRAGNKSRGAELVPAAPEYIADKIKSLMDIPPGHRFQLYFNGLKKDFEPIKDEKREALKEIQMCSSDLLKNLSRRVEAICEDGLVLKGTLTSPLAIGLGNPHPVENGFAFLSPYGVPYISGSAVKGVVRRAAEDFALFDDNSGWSIPLVWALFGFDEKSGFFSKGKDYLGKDWQEAYKNWASSDKPDSDEVLTAWLDLLFNGFKEKDKKGFLNMLLENEEEKRSIHWKGLLIFLDSFPEKCELGVDILNPHHKSYYEGNGTPNDTEDPNPVFFLTLKQGAELTFGVKPLKGNRVQKRERLWEAIDNWQLLIEKAFRHAFGFGAKTTVGYGQVEMKNIEMKKSEPETQEADNKVEPEEKLEDLDEPEKSIRTVQFAECDDKGQTQIGNIYKNLNSFEGEAKKTLAEALKEYYIKCGKWEGKQSKKQEKKIKQIKEILGEV